jgi:transcriptional regulator with XRE-family HTH domain
MPRSKANTGRKARTPPPPEMSGLAERLTRVFEDRKRRHGLTQKDLSRNSGVSQSTISEIMNAEEPKIGVTAAVIARLCIALDVDADWLLMGLGDDIPALAKRSASSRIPVSIELGEENAPLAPPPTLSPPTIHERTRPRPAARKRQSP